MCDFCLFSVFLFSLKGGGCPHDAESSGRLEMYIIFVKKERMLRREIVVETTCYSRPKGEKQKEEPATCAEHEDKLIYWIWKKQIVKNELNLRK